MAVKTNITINIVEPGSDVPVPDTGLFTHGIGNAETTIIVSAALVTVLVILSIVLTTYMYRKHKKQGRTTKLVHLVDSTKAVFTNKKRVTIGLTALALLASISTLTALLSSANKNNTNAIEGEEGLTINAESKELTIEVKDQPVFAVLPVQVTVEEATQAGYTLTAYTDNTDLVSTTNPNNKISMVALPETAGELSPLTDNTYGLALGEEPTTKDAEVYMPLSIDSDIPTIIKSMPEYTPTAENDTTTIYYGFYITPDVPYGTYTGGEVEYEAEENKVATVTFDGNGLYFDNDPGQTQNVVKYIPGRQSEPQYSHTSNINDKGEVIDSSNPKYPLDTNETFVYSFPGMLMAHIDIVRTGNDSCCGPDQNDYFSFWAGNHPEYTALANYGSSERVFSNTTGKYRFGDYDNVNANVAIGGSEEQNSITFAYTTSADRDNTAGGSNGYGYYAIITGYIPNTIVSGDYESPGSSATHNFLGWSINKNATVATYKNQEDIASSLDLSGEDVILYAVWQEGIEITYDGNGADDKTNMNNIEQHGYAFDLLSASLQVDLLASNFQRKGYGFVGWSTDLNAWDKLTDDDDSNNPTIFGPNQTIAIDENLIAKAGENRKLIMYAIWAPAEKDLQGNPVYFQNWTGCGSLGQTTYDSATNTLAVSKNTITALTDNRDNNVYTVARLADGNCWMIENLRLDDSAVITTTNTNNPVTIDGNVAIKNDDGTITDHLSASSDEWSDPNHEYANLNTNNLTATTASPYFSQDFTSFIHKDLSDNIYSYGNYYNWTSAAAGRDSRNSGRASGDICPIGWKLPTGGRNNANPGSFYYLNQRIGGDTSATFVIGAQQNSNNWRSFPNNYIYSGGFEIIKGAVGKYWASDKSYYNAFDLDVRNYGAVDPATNINSASSGLSVRCLILVGQ